MSNLCATSEGTTLQTLVETFADALAHYRYFDIEPMLTEGEFNCMNRDDELEEKADKATFMEYITRICEPLLLSSAQPAIITYDQCLHCSIGSPVVIFNDGIFPYKATQPYERQKNGLMLQFEGDLICGVTFCGLFVSTKNEYHYEVKRRSLSPCNSQQDRNTKA
jgi:hypothetical protein